MNEALRENIRLDDGAQKSKARLDLTLRVVGLNGCAYNGDVPALRRDVVRVRDGHHVDICRGRGK